MRILSFSRRHFVVALGALCTAPVFSMDLAQDRHARCGFGEDAASVQVSQQENNREILEQEPPPRELDELGCLDRIKEFIDANPGIPGSGAAGVAATRFVSQFGCDAVEQAQQAVVERFDDFAQTPFGSIVATVSGGNPLPVFSSPSPYAPPELGDVTNPVFGSGAPSSPGGGASGGGSGGGDGFSLPAIDFDAIYGRSSGQAEQ